MKRFVAMMTLLLGSMAAASEANTLPFEKLKEKVQEAQKLLEETTVTYRLISNRQRAKIALEREVAIVGLKVDSGELKKFTYQELVPLTSKGRRETPPLVVARSANCELLWLGGNRYGLIQESKLICDNVEYAVVAKKMWRMISARGIAHNHVNARRCAKRTELVLISYNPYAADLHTDEAVLRGNEYLTQVIGKAQEELRNVQSRAFPGNTLSQIARKQFLVWLLADEHMDHEEFFEAQKNGFLSELFEKFLVELAYNRENTKRWSVSSAGACCLAQFICPTYNRVLTEYPEAGLNQEFMRGMQDHVNAIKAMIILLDSDMSRWWTDKTRKICSVSQAMLEDCWAASYNGGPNALNRAVNRWGKLWDQYFDRRSETYTYLLKLRSLRALQEP